MAPPSRKSSVGTLKRRKPLTSWVITDSDSKASNGSPDNGHDAVDRNNDSLPHMRKRSKKSNVESGQGAEITHKIESESQRQAVIAEAEDCYTEGCSLLDAIDDGLAPEVEDRKGPAVVTLKFGNPRSAHAVSTVLQLLERCIFSLAHLSQLSSERELNGTVREETSRSLSNPRYLQHLALCELGEIQELRIGDRKRAQELYHQSVEVFREGAEGAWRLAKLLYTDASSAQSLLEVEHLLKNCAIANAERLLADTEDEASDFTAIPLHDPALVQRELSFLAPARDRLALLYCQTGRDSLAVDLLRDADYEWRLGRGILNYPSALEGVKSPHRKHDLTPKPTAVTTSLVQAVDDSLPPSLFNHLREVFKPSSSFWTAHGYNEHQSNGYFSYVVDLRAFTGSNDSKKPPTLFHCTLQYLLRLASHLFPERSQSITHAEFWAHCRPHTSGHQFHFDSENEGHGKGGPRHPPCTAIVVLSDGTVGGPTIVTEQVLKTRKVANGAKRGLLKSRSKADSNEVETKTGLADSAYAVNVAPGRVTVFRADVLHGVVPGKPPTPPSQERSPTFSNRRISFMVGFWDGMKARTPPSLPDGRPK
ncbi:hypothetical protein HDU93_009965, partial [Gonapodya sp. JEL0774]